MKSCKNTKDINNAHGGLECSKIWKNAEQDSSQINTLVIPELLPEMRGEEILYTWQPAVDEKTKPWEDIADAYVIVKEKNALSGIIIYALRGKKWKANPFHMRPLVKQLLRNLGKQV